MCANKCYTKQWLLYSGTLLLRHLIGNDGITISNNTWDQHNIALHLLLQLFFITVQYLWFVFETQPDRQQGSSKSN